MPFRGYLTLNGLELANTSRVAAHLGHVTPTTDSVFAQAEILDCTPEIHDLLYIPPEGCIEVRELLCSVPDGARQWSSLLVEFGPCWGPPALCLSDTECSTVNLFTDDGWDELPEFLGDDLYRTEIAPWYSLRVPESAEFGGVWLMDVTGLDSTPVERSITEMVGHGAAAGPHRDASRTMTFEALLVACTNAGVEFGLKWLSCNLRDATTSSDNVLTYLAAHPGRSGAIPESLVRQVRRVVLTKAPEVTERLGGRRNPRRSRAGVGSHDQANIYRVSWEMSALSPYVYLPPVTVPVVFGKEEFKRINWVHSLDCALPDTCLEMPILFSTVCAPDVIDVEPSLPPVCGGCMPVCEVLQHTFDVPLREHPYHCRETAVSYEIRNLGESPLTFQSFWRVCGADVRCEATSWPLQVSGMPAASTLILDSVSGRFHAIYDGRRHYPLGVVGTPTGAPWRPAIIDRAGCWEWIVLTDGTCEFEVTMTFTDREP